jgi:hypothetical protein
LNSSGGKTGEAIKEKILTNNFKSHNGSSLADFFSDQSSCRIDPPQEYENQLQKLESDIRNHIRVRINSHSLSHILNFLRYHLASDINI